MRSEGPSRSAGPAASTSFAGSDWLSARMDMPPPGALGWLRAVARGLPIALAAYGGLIVMLVVRLVERPLFGLSRPWTPYITQAVCRFALWVMGIRLTVRGTPMTQPGAIVANHSSWLDIFSLNAVSRVYFVSKDDVAAWPGIGWLARATGTVFIARKGTEAKAQQEVFETRLRAGHRLLFFPEGTSTDSLRILPFKSTLFAAFYGPRLEHLMHVQPVTVIYRAPADRDPRFFGWWGDMGFGPHLLAVLAAPAGGEVEVVLHPEVPVSAFEGRKALSAHCERVIRASHPFAAARWIEG